MKKIIGICTTKVNEELCRSFLSVFHEAARKRGFCTVVFHSIYDFYNSDESEGARQLFKMLPFDRLSALIIMRDCIYNEELLELIMGEAVKSGIPVIMIRGQDDRCSSSIVGDFEEAYKKLIRSVVEKQGITDTFFLAGRKNSDPDSEHRLAVYRKVLEGCGIPFDEKTMLGYGEYRDIPAEEAAKKLVEGGKTPPRAVFCANDIMAFSVMRVLKREGYSIPQDVIVTGFDGLEHSVYCVPSLSTCREDINALAVLAADTADRLINGEEVPKIQHYPYKAIISESSEENIYDRSERRETGVFNRLRIDAEDEAASSRWLDTVISEPCMKKLRQQLPLSCSGGNSVCIRADAYFGRSSAGSEPESYLMLRSGTAAGRERLIASKDIMGELLDSVVPRKTMYISMISKDDYIYGIACSESEETAYESGRIFRFVRTLNRALLAAISGEEMLRREEEKQSAKYYDSLTGLVNNDGTNKWYEKDFLSGEKPCKQLTVGVYIFINYQELLDKCGAVELEEKVKFVAKSLRFANPEGTVVARISPDTFAVLVPHNMDYYGNEVDREIGMFYGFLDIMNKKAEHGQEVEVSCGYTDVMPPWKSKVGDYINAAISELYKNRVQYNKSKPKDLDPTDGAEMMMFQSKLLTLLNKNLFSFHFQPIVDARSGDIVAYEALMRTAPEIGLNPLEVLSIAGMCKKLNNVEFACFSNILETCCSMKDKLGGRDVFINTIPGFFLNDAQCGIIYDKYKDIMPHVVVEITESETVTSAELDSIRSFGGNTQNLRVAVDDYGTGHSNVVNLIEYAPQIVKADRYLINNIHTDKNKQRFVKNLIEFSRENNIMVLAEGVETQAELETVIDFGFDFIQGYYTARPSPEIIDSIPAEIKKQITDRASGK